MSYLSLAQLGRDFFKVDKIAHYLMLAALAILAVSAVIVSLSSERQTVEIRDDQPRIVLLYDIGGKFDKSFNEAALTGVQRWADESGYSFQDFEPTSEAQFEQALKRFARRGSDLIIAVGIAYAVALERVAPDYPDTRFMAVDAMVDQPNVRYATFAEAEGSFIVGALAAMKSQSGTVGFIGGMDIPLIRRFARGYEAGAKHINPDIALIETYVGNTPAAWNDPIKAAELARSQYQRGADIVFHASGPSGLGVIQAAKETDNLVIGVDSNQNGVAPGFVLTSMLKRVDVAVYQSIKDVLADQWTTGQEQFGLADQGVDYALDEHNRHMITDADVAVLSDLKTGIIEGRLTVLEGAN